MKNAQYDYFEDVVFPRLLIAVAVLSGLGWLVEIGALDVLLHMLPGA